MAKQNNENFNTKLNIYYIPPNIINSGKLFGFPYINWISGVIMAAISCGAICLIPFVVNIKILFCVLSFLVFMYINLIGIKGRSIPSVVIDELKYRKKARLSHFLPATRNLKKKSISAAGEENMSDIEKLFSKVGKRYKELEYRYGEEHNIE